MSFSLIYICCSFRGGILSVVFPTVAICFWPAGNLECPCLFSDLILFPFLLLFFLTRREPGVPLSLFRPYPLHFSPPFLLYCYLPFLFFYLIYICFSPPFLLFLTLPFLLCLFHWSISAVVSFYLLFSLLVLLFLYCSLPFLFFYVFFIDLYLL